MRYRQLGTHGLLLTGLGLGASPLGGTAVFLAARASDYIHGAVSLVDGGWLRR